MNLPASVNALRYALRHPYVRLALWVDLALVVALAVGAALWWPTAREHQTLASAVDAKRQQLVFAQQAGTLVRAFRHAQVAVPRLEGKLRLSARQSDLVDQLGRLARQHGVRIVSQSFDDGKARGAYLPLQVNLGLQGPYGALRDFMDGLPSLPVWTEILEASLERSRESPEAVRAQLRLLAFRHTGSVGAAAPVETGGGRPVIARSGP